MDKFIEESVGNLGVGQGDVGLDKNAEKIITEEQEKLSAPSQLGGAEEDEWLDILGSGQLKKKIIKKGNSERPERSFVCVISYEGCLYDGTIVDGDLHASIQIGDGEVIQGLDLALPLMAVGEIALLEVAPRFSYGSLGRLPDIGPDMTLIYQVELHSAEPEQEVDSFTMPERKKIGNRKRERGNWWYSRQQPTLAIQCYRRALDYLDDVEGGITLTPDNEDDNKPISQDLRELLNDRLKVYNNLAAAQMQINAYDTALNSVEYVLRCQPNNVKALFRKGKIFAATGDFTKSVEVLRKASELEPENKIIKQELNKIQLLKKGDSILEKNLYKRMFGQGKKSEMKERKENKQSKLYTWAMLLASTTALVAGLIAYRYKF